LLGGTDPFLAGCPAALKIGSDAEGEAVLALAVSPTSSGTGPDVEGATVTGSFANWAMYFYDRTVGLADFDDFVTIRGCESSFRRRCWAG
jgi:hypothetical protein